VAKALSFRDLVIRWSLSFDRKVIGFCAPFLEPYTARVPPVDEVTEEHAPLEWETPLFHQAIAQFEQAVPSAEVSEAIVERLSLPERSLIVSVPIKLDDGRRAVFPGYRVQHSSVLGPTKGGVRYAPHVSLGECAALSMWMTWKCALLRLPYGGAKGGIRCDPRALSSRELQAITRRFTAELLPVIGPQEDIPAPDMATDEQTMAWMMDTYSMQVGHAVPEIVTGKPISIGGSVFRAEATGAGVVMVVERACRRLGWEVPGQRCVVQGFGKVGAVAAHELHDRGARVIAVSDISGGLYDEAGLDIPSLYGHALEQGHASLAEHEGEHVTNEELLELPCDILVLAALEEQVTGENAPRVKARMVAEGANGPTTVEADAVFADRGVPVLPDILTNAGGVTVSYFEWVQDIGRLFWDRDEIRSRLADKMGDAFERVWELADARGITLRQAALVTGIREVAAALNDRGLYP
jgi:glutamate dehydrogenase (NAD(P)+)